MDSHTHNAVSEAVKLAKQNTLSATAGQTNKIAKNTKSASGSTTTDHAKDKRDRAAAKTAKAALHNAQQGHDAYKLARRKTRYAKHQFPFLRLPAEIRNRVYKLALASPGRCYLTKVKPPPLYKVSKQICSEAAGLYTAVNSFEVNVHTSYIPFAADQTPLFPAFMPNDVGLLHIDEDRRQWLSDDKVVFRDIGISVFGTYAGRSYIGAFVIGGEDNQGKIVAKSMILDRRNVQHVEALWADIKVGIDKLLKDAQARPGFAGLKFSDLEKIAKCFDYVKPE